MQPSVRMRRLTVLTGCACVLACAAWARQILRAEDVIARESAGRPGMLLMRNGRVVEGRILKTGDDYEVQIGSQGKIFVPGGQVSMRCEDVREACVKLRDNMRNHRSPGGHCALARWCITNQLLSEAREELNQALELEPDHEEARNLMLRLNGLLDPRPSADSETQSGPSKVLQQAPRAPQAAAESIGSLSRAQAQQFTRRIQPMLVNNCAVAGCHDAESQTGFRLQRIVLGADTSRIGTERNLTEVLAHIDVRNPRASTLLTMSKGRHGRRGKEAFAGPRGQQQFEEIRQWVQSVAKTEMARAKNDGVAPRFSHQIEQTAATTDGAEPERSGKISQAPARRGDSPLQAADPFGVMRHAASSDGSRSRDPFDPTAFNRGSAPANTRR